MPKKQIVTDYLTGNQMLLDREELQVIQQARQGASGGGGGSSSTGSGYSPATKVVATSSSGFAADYKTSGGDDASQIQAALNAISALGGGSLYIKAGTYNIGTSLTVPANTLIFGDGFATILRYPNGSDYNGLLFMNSVYNSHIKNLMVDGNQDNVTFSPPNDMIILKNSYKCSVEGVYLYNCIDSAIVLDQLLTTDCMIKNNWIDTTKDIGVYISVAGNNQIQGNIVLNTGSYGIRNINAGANRSMIENNRVINCGQIENVDGIILDNADNSVVSGNLVYQAGRYGIQCSTAFTSVTGNVIINADKHGIYLDNPQRSTVTGNTINSCGQDATNTYSGIYLNNASECTIVGNRSDDLGTGTRQKYGIEEAGTSDQNIILGNMVRRNLTGGILVLGVATQVGHNITL